MIQNLKNLVNLDLVKFDPPTRKLEGKLSFMTLKSEAKFEEKLTCGLENDMRNLADFHQST